jgi:hypothetical protein
VIGGQSDSWSQLASRWVLVVVCSLNGGADLIGRSRVRPAIDPEDLECEAN